MGPSPFPLYCCNDCPMTAMLVDPVAPKINATP